jgi:hypothetical protein
LTDLATFATFVTVFDKLPRDIDYNQTAIGLPPVTSAVFLIAKSFW